MTQILKAKPIVEKKLSFLKSEVASLGRKPGLAILLVGNNPASSIYVKNKIKKAQEIGASAKLFHLEENCSADEFLKVIHEINQNDDIDGALIQLPLPEQLKKLKINSLVQPHKDVDGFHPENIAKLYLGESGIVPCTPKGILTLFQHYQIDIAGKNVTIIGRSNIVGKPLASLLNHHNATISLCHSKTKNLKEHTLKADIVISAIGSPCFLDESYFKEEHIVIDVGITQSQEKIVGDVDFENVKNKVTAITPVPGGVGPLTVISLMENLVQAAKDKHE